MIDIEDIQRQITELYLKRELLIKQMQLLDKEIEELEVSEESNTCNL